MTTLDKVTAEWDKDCHIDKTEPGMESMRIAELHNKYYKMLIETKRHYNNEMLIFKKLYKKKWEYFMGILDVKEINALGWELVRHKILRQDVDKYLEADGDLAKYTTSIQEQKFVIDKLEAILSRLAARNYEIKNFIEWQQFINGS